VDDNGCKGGGKKESPMKVLGKEEVEEIKKQLLLGENLQEVRHKLLVLSGKGGVGKSTVAASIAVALSLKGKKIGLMDIDVHGPSIPKILGLEGAPLMAAEEGLFPIRYSNGLDVISIGFFLPDQDNPVIWRAPLKHSMIRQFLTEVKWGELDYLVIDCPPGTGDEPLSVVHLLEKEQVDGAVVVTTPQDVALTDVRKSITFCRTVNLPIIGVVENMSGFVCPHCGETVDIFKRGGGEKMAREMGVPFLGNIPLDPLMVEAGDSGKPFMQHFPDSATARAFDRILEPILALE